MGLAHGLHYPVCVVASSPRMAGKKVSPEKAVMITNQGVNKMNKFDMIHKIQIFLGVTMGIVLFSMLVIMSFNAQLKALFGVTSILFW